MLNERGTAVLESVFAMVMLLFLTLGGIEVAFVLYARNIVAASAHEGARAAVELGRTPAEAEAVATEIVRGSASGLVRDLRVYVGVRASGERSIIRVRVTGRLRSFGPVPVALPVASTATITRRERPA